jgi:hypothetical protein
VERWRDSGLSADQFAAELGINAGTLKFWKYKLGLPVGEKRRKEKPKPLPLVELRTAPVAQASAFELEVRAGRRVHVPAGFDADALKRLLAVLESA